IGLSPKRLPVAGLSIATTGALVSRSSTAVAVASPPQFLATSASVVRPSSGPRAKPARGEGPAPGTAAARPVAVTAVALPAGPARSTRRVPTRAPGAGAVSATVGAAIVTRTVTRVVLPPVSVASTSTRPGSLVARLAVVAKLPSAAGMTATPLTLSWTGPSA